MADNLLINRQDGVVSLTLHRPGLHNAFDAGLIAALTTSLQSLGNDDTVRVVVLQATGASFSAGADLGWMRAMADAPEADNREDALRLARLMRTLDELPKPTIAQVQGPAYGGGVGLVACCDIAIGTPDATFGLSEARLGLLPAVISPYVVAAIGVRQARRWFASAERFDAQQALQMGLLHSLVDATELQATVDRQVDLLLRAAPKASATAKALVRRVATTAHRDLQDEENAALIASLRASDEGREGLSAFLEKRQPAWTATSRLPPA